MSFNFSDIEDEDEFDLEEFDETGLLAQASREKDHKKCSKCRRNQNSRNKTQIMIKKQHEENVKDWGPNIKELGKSVTRDKV